ncbi:ATP-dependent zinc protease, partial [Pseudomonas aeruginosa]
MKRALALLSLFALPVLAAEPNLHGRYAWVSLPELDRTLHA